MTVKNPQFFFFLITACYYCSSHPKEFQPKGNVVLCFWSQEPFFFSPSIFFLSFQLAKAWNLYTGKRKLRVCQYKEYSEGVRINRDCKLYNKNSFAYVYEKVPFLFLFSV